MQVVFGHVTVEKLAKSNQKATQAQLVRVFQKKRNRSLQKALRISPGLELNIFNCRLLRSKGFRREAALAQPPTLYNNIPTQSGTHSNDKTAKFMLSDGIILGDFLSDKSG
jgi:hypothetical protein